MNKISNFTIALVRSGLVLSWFGTWAACAQPLPPGRNVNDPIPGYEVATQQIGGAGWWRYTAIGALRCQSATHAIVAVNTRKGTLVDYIQIGCAPVKPTRNYKNGWGWDSTQVYWPAGKGNINCGLRGRYTVCAQNSVISGFRAVYRDGNSYLQDLRFQCSPIRRVADQAWELLKVGPPVIQIYRTWTDAGWLTSTRIKSYQPGFPDAGPAADSDDMNVAGKSQFIAESCCTGGGASALSVAVGRWFALFQPIGTDVVQAFQMFCRGSSIDLRVATPEAPGH